jgi:hypothetical protein
VDISYLKLNDISPEIAQALESLFKNLLKIYERNILSKYFNIYKRKVRKIKFKKGLQLLNKMFERYLINIKSGEVLMKINFNSKNCKKNKKKWELPRKKVPTLLSCPTSNCRTTNSTSGSEQKPC